MKKVLISGATGLIGQAIEAKCLDQNIAVNYLSTSRSKLKNEPKLKGFYWNPKTSEIDLDAFKGVECIINLAGASIAKRWTRSYKKEIVSSRVDSLNLIYKTIKEHNLQIVHLISASAVGYYPNSESVFYDENFKSDDNSFIVNVVKQWETAADHFEDLDIDIAKIRIGLVLSNQGGALPKIVKPIKYFIGAPLGTGKQWQSWIHIDDLASIFMYVLEHKLKGVYNGVAPNPVAQSTLTQEIANKLNRPLFLPNVPSFVLKLMMGKMSSIVLNGQRVSSKKIEDSGFNFEHYQLSQALGNIFDR